MKKKTVFEERQRFTQWWLWLIVIVMDAGYSFALGRHIFLQIQAGLDPQINTGMLIPVVIVFLITLLFILLRLDTIIDDAGIHVRFFPFHLSFRHYGWETISNCFVRKYKPLLEYGGWGIRGTGKNKALNVKGDMGIQIEFFDGKRLLIGTSKFEEVSKVLTGRE
jgi:hypothetical protein